jgi:nucleoside-diphosphate-sugar epimerase
MKVVVAGGSGFLGSHLSRALLDRGDDVLVIDNLCTGNTANIADLNGRAGFRFIDHDITQPFESNPSLMGALAAGVDRICNLASPASPPTYQKLSVETLLVGSVGMQNLLDLAVSHNARILQASTSEVYGDPDVHPQPESYWGRVNPNGPRSMYDESKRFAEAMCAAYVVRHGVDLRTVRIFNTYGPWMSPDDGRVVTNFVGQALRGEPLTIFGDGTQTRSFCFVSDQVAGQLALLDSTVTGPVNIGNPGEFTMLELAELVSELTGSTAGIVHRPLPGDDPLQRRPDITRAQNELGWQPTVALREGLERTIAWFRTLPEYGGTAAAPKVA